VPTSTRPTSERTAKASVTASISVAKKNDAAALFGSAQEARAAGRVDQAAALLAELLERFPHDSRAGLAAFELGRIRLASGDAKGALDAFDQAAGASNMFDEQVDARRIQALEQIGDLAVCRTARKSFLRRFPNGAFAAVVRRRCP
jgi:tetratricopeptide (TPR) repeat protein